MMTLSGGRRGTKPERATWWFRTQSARQRHSSLGAGGTGRGLLSLDGWTVALDDEDFLPRWSCGQSAVSSLITGAAGDISAHEELRRIQLK